MHHYSSWRYWKLPLLLYSATWLTTTFCRFGFDDSDTLYHFLLTLCLFVSGADSAPEYWIDFCHRLWLAVQFSGALMFILTCHELGHYLQSLRYRVKSSLPYFLPIPFGVLGTLGAVIVMDDEVPNRKALFDIGISGPLAGLIPTLVCLYFGIQWSHFGPRLPGGPELGDPLIFQWAVYWFFGPTPHGMLLHAHPIAMAAWAGLLLTSLNLVPFGQLDGGHVFYALLGRRSYPLVKIAFVVMIIAVAYFQLWHWSLILILIAMIGVTHPPTGNEKIRLTWFRHWLGWATLMFVFVGITPTPIIIDDPVPVQKPALYCVDCQKIRFPFLYSDYARFLDTSISLMPERQSECR